MKKLILLTLGCSLLLLTSVFVAKPAQGTLNPTSTAPLPWDGDAVGGPAVTTEALCQDGINCDVFTIHLTGKASDYAGKQLQIKITFLPASDYDIYVHKDTLAGKTVFAAGNGSQPDTGRPLRREPSAHPVRT